MHLFIHSSVNCHCHEVLKWCFIWQIKIKNMLNSYFIIFSLLILPIQGCVLMKYLYREVGPGLGTPAIALVSFNSMYLFGNNLEYVFIQ